MIRRSLAVVSLMAVLAGLAAAPGLHLHPTGHEHEVGRDAQHGHAHEGALLHRHATPHEAPDPHSSGGEQEAPQVLSLDIFVFRVVLTPLAPEPALTALAVVPARPDGVWASAPVDQSRAHGPPPPPASSPRAPPFPAA